MAKNSFFCIPLLFLLAACTWVKPTDQGREISIVELTDEALKTCDKLGSMTSMVKHKVGSFNRSEEKVATELATIAQNEAAQMGGDTIAAEGPIADGERTFSIYRCRK